MEQSYLKLLGDINRAVIKFRGVYSAWSKQHGISYHEMLVLYTIRDQGFCTQKGICDCYLLPRQTMNNVMTDLRSRGLLEISPEHCRGREKAFTLTEAGRAYAAPLLASLDRIETQAVEAFGGENLCKMAQAVALYGDALEQAVKENP